MLSTKAGERFGVEVRETTIEGFVDYVNSNNGQELQPLLDRYLYSGSWDGRFRLSWRREGSHHFSELGIVASHERFPIDADYGLVLTYHPFHNFPIALAVTSFTLDRDGTKSKVDVEDEDQRLYPRIMQIQALTSRNRDKGSLHSQTVGVLNRFAFERASTEIVIEMARFADVAAIAMLPADLNPNRHHMASKLRGENPEHKALEHFRKRYDQVAEFFGMVRQSPQGLFVGSLT